MYSIKVMTDGETCPLFLSGVEELAILDPVLTLEMGMQGSLTFRVPVTHPYRDKIRILSSEFFVYQENEEIFRGRFIGKEEDFYLTGAVTCEGDLAYLIDSQQPPYEHQGSIKEFMDARVVRHNSCVEGRKRFKIGNITVVDNNNYINRSNSDYSDTLACLRDKLVGTHGGYLRTRLENGIRYLDYIYDYGGINSQVIRFGENLLDMTRYIDSTTLITALIPRGAEVEYEDELGETQTRIVDITSVNEGSDYIYDQDAVNRYGWIFGVQHWEDVTLPENLLKKARTYLEEAVNLPETMELTAVDLSRIDVDIEKLRLGYWTQVMSGVHKISGRYLLTKKVMHLDDPGKDTVTLGGAVASFSSSTAKNMMDISRRVQRTAEYASQEINRKVENATTLITGGFGGYVVLDNIDPSTGKKMHPWRILVMNAPDKAVASNVIQINQNGIGFSTTGINGPYRNAWTIDGNLVADFVTTGTMLADRIRGGTLEVGGAGLGKDGVVMVKDASGNMLCRIDKAGMQFYDGANNVTAVINKDGVDVRKGSIRGANLTLGGFGNADGTMVLLDASGNVLCSADNTGFKIYRGIVASYSPDGRNRSTVSDGSFKTWLGNEYIVYLGEGGYENHGSKGSAVLWLDGSHGILLDANSGKITCRDIEADRSVKVRDLDVRGEIDASGNIICTGSRIECSGDIHAKNVWCENLARYSDIEKLAKNSRVDELERRIAALGG